MNKDEKLWQWGVKHDDSETFVVCLNSGYNTHVSIYTPININHS